MTTHQELFDTLVANAKAKMEEAKVPGMALAIQYDGQTHTAVLGNTSVTNPLPVTTDTIFQIGSTSKTYTAFMLAKLVEDGKLKLTDPVKKYVPDLDLPDKQVRDSVTIEQLLTHTAGWDGDLFTDTGNGDDALEKYVALIADAPQVVPNGAHFSYNNAAFNLAGRVIECVTEGSYEAAVKQMIFEPLGLQDSFYFPADIMLKRFVVGHHLTPEGDVIIANPWPIPRSANPAGGIACSILDLLKYGQMMLRGAKTEDGTELLSAETYALLTQPRKYVGPGKRDVALSWFTQETEVGRIIEHGGTTNGQNAELMILPEQGFIFAMTVNASHARQVMQPVMKEVLQSFLNLTLPEVEPVDADGVDLSAYVGRYTRPISDLEIKLDEQGVLKGKVVFRPALGDRAPDYPEFTLAYAGTDTLVITDTNLKGFDLVMIRDDQQRVGWARFGLRIFVGEKS